MEARLGSAAEDHPACKFSDEARDEKNPLRKAAFDGAGRVAASKGRSDGRIRWDVLLPSVQDWATALAVGPLRA